MNINHHLYRCMKYYLHWLSGRNTQELQTLHKEGDNREIQQGDAIWLLRVMIEQPICPKVGSWSLSVQTSYKSIRK